MATIFRPMPRPTESPWGAIQDADQDLPGIWWVSSASHGGFILSPERRAAMPEAMREFRTVYGGNAYEEQTDCAVVILAYAAEFPALQVRMALRAIATAATFESVGAPRRAQLNAIQHHHIAARSAAHASGPSELLATRKAARRAMSKAGAT